MEAKIYISYNFYSSTWRNNMMTGFLFLNISRPKPEKVEGEKWSEILNWWLCKLENDSTAILYTFLSAAG